MAFRSISDNYTITTEGELSIILQNFDSDMIIDVLDNNMRNKYREYEYNLTNIVASYEYAFNDLTKEYGSDMRIIKTRDQVYTLIIDRLLKFHRIEMVNTEINIDNYTLSSTLYELLVSKFTTFISEFFISYMMREKESLYNMLMSTVDDKKLKNISMTYYKKLNADPKLAAIHAYTPTIVNNICAFPISLHQYITILYKDQYVRDMLLNILVDNEYFFHDFIVPFVNEHISRIITDIRLILQSMLPMITLDTNI